MLPSAVLTHLKAGGRTAVRPSRCGSADASHPASVTPRKQARPSLTTVLGGSRLRRASFSTSLRRKPSTRRSFRRTGWPSGVGLHGDNDRRLAGRAAAAFATGASATERGIVDLDPTGKAFARIPLHHHLHELVFELPGGVLGHTEASSRLAIPPLLCVRWVHGAEPSAQRHLGRGENRAGDQRGLPSAGRALVEVAGASACRSRGRQSRAASASETQPPATDPRFRKVHRSASR